MRTEFNLFLIVLLVSANGCREEYNPKPRGYFRIELPEKEYRVYDSICPFSFEYPVYAEQIPSATSGEKCWMNIDFSSLNATLHISYKEIDGNLLEYLSDARSLAMKHTQRASDIREVPVIRDSTRVFGLLYDIRGNAASSLQFYLTDSTDHFLRASLYFNNVPNIDSVAPVLDFVRKDIDRLIETFNWK